MPPQNTQVPPSPVSPMPSMDSLQKNPKFIVTVKTFVIYGAIAWLITSLVGMLTSSFGFSGYYSSFNVVSLVMALIMGAIGSAVGAAIFYFIYDPLHNWVKGNSFLSKYIHDMFSLMWEALSCRHYHQRRIWTPQHAGSHRSYCRHRHGRAIHWLDHYFCCGCCRLLLVRKDSFLKIVGILSLVIIDYYEQSTKRFRSPFGHYYHRNTARRRRKLRLLSAYADIDGDAYCPKHSRRHCNHSTSPTARTHRLHQQSLRLQYRISIDGPDRQAI